MRTVSGSSLSKPTGYLVRLLLSIVRQVYLEMFYFHNHKFEVVIFFICVVIYVFLGTIGNLPNNETRDDVHSTVDHTGHNCQ